METNVKFVWDKVDDHFYIGKTQIPNYYKWISLDEIIVYDTNIKLIRLSVDFVVNNHVVNILSLNEPSRHFKVLKNDLKLILDLRDSIFYTKYNIENSYMGNFVISLEVVDMNFSFEQFKLTTILAKYTYELWYEWMTYYPRRIKNVLMGTSILPIYRHCIIGAHTYIIPKNQNKYNYCLYRKDYKTRSRFNIRLDIPERKRITGIHMSMPDERWREAIVGIRILDNYYTMERWYLDDGERDDKTSIFFSSKKEVLNLEFIDHPQLEFVFKEDVEKLVEPFVITFYYVNDIIYRDGQVSIV